MFECQILNANGQIIYSTLGDNCKGCVATCKTKNEIIDHCPQFKNKRRRGKASTSIGDVYVCTEDINYIKSSKLFKLRFSIYEALLEEIVRMKESISDTVNKDSKRLIHNLTSLNAHNIQELYNLVPQDILTQDYREQIKTIKKTIAEQPDKTAQMFIRLAKNNAAMKTEFAVFKKLYESNPVLQPKKHLVRKVLLNVLHTFFQDFTDQGIYVEVKDDPNTLEFDYESIHVALYHILENATKYAAINSKIVISFKLNQDSFDVVFDMLSIQIGKEEILLILEEGGRGSIAKLLGKQGGGIGLNHIIKILKLNSSELIINYNYKPSEGKYIGGYKYEYNQFIIRFNDISTLNKRR